MINHVQELTTKYPAKSNIAVLIGDDFAYPDAFDNFREADDLIDLEGRRLRLLRPSQHWPLHLAGNIREVHSTIAEEW